MVQYGGDRSIRTPFWVLPSAAAKQFPLILDTEDFSCWEAAVTTSLGHYCSELLASKDPFQTSMRRGLLGGYTLLHFRGKGGLRLNREQVGGSLLWLPLRGMIQESINGTTVLAEPGRGLLFQPGDAMVGDTSQELEGLSILIPETLHPRQARKASPLLSEGPLQQMLLSCARQLAVAAARQPAGAEHAADQLTEALRAWSASHTEPPIRERITAIRRRATVQSAREWMAPRLQERFGVLELSRALNLSPRQLQYSFLQELGRSPMAEAKRLRLQRLRSLLLDRSQNHRSIAELMATSGLIASGVTSADYRHWCGENPRQTRLGRR